MIASRRPLAGRSVLVTRDPGTWPRLRERLEELGAATTFRAATCQVAPLDAGAVHAAIKDLAAYHWLVFTSASGVRFLFDAASERGADLSRFPGRTAAVGPATARAVADAFGRQAALVSAAGLGVHLGGDLAKAVGDGERILVVRPEVSSGGLASALRRDGVPFEEVAVYRTIPAPWAADLATSIARRHHDVVVFTAPSALRTLLDAAGAFRGSLDDGLRATHRVAIGPTTARALAEVDFPAEETALEPGEEAVLAAVLAAVSKDTGPGTVC